ncbi:MAG: hypothetical protein Q4D26_10995 [Clostridia bacterium]|nr:hypothetical protein [Clostridia bacterium]
MNIQNLTSDSTINLNSEKSNNNIYEQIKAVRNEYNDFVEGALNKCIIDAKELSGFINIISQFPKLSIKNCLAIFAQKPEAKELFSTELIEKASGRINKGEKGISLLVPKTVNNSGTYKTFYNIKKFFDIKQIILPKVTAATNHRESVDAISADCLNITNAIKGVSSARIMYVNKEDSDKYNSYYDFKTKISYINANQSLEKMTYDMIKNLVSEKGYFGKIKNPLREQYMNLTTATVANHFNVVTPKLNVDIFKECTVEDALNVLDIVKEQANHLINKIEYELYPQLLYKNYDITYSNLEDAMDSNNKPLYNKEQLHQFKLAFEKNFNPAEMSVICSAVYSSETISQGIRSISENIPLHLVNSLLKHYNSQQISALRLIYMLHPSNKRMEMVLNPALTGLQLYGLHKILTNDMNHKIDDCTFTNLSSGYYDNQQLETIAILVEEQLSAEQLKKIIDTRLDSSTMITIKEAYISGVDQSEVDQIIASFSDSGIYNKSPEIKQLLNEIMNKHNAEKNIFSDEDFSLEALIESAEREVISHNNDIPTFATDKTNILNKNS